MGLVDASIKPGHWQIERIGKSGARYKLRFSGTRFFWISRLTVYKGYGEPLYWRRLYTMPATPLHNPRPRSKLLLDAFRDLDLPVNSFTRGRHVRFNISR